MSTRSTCSSDNCVMSTTKESFRSRRYFRSYTYNARAHAHAKHLAINGIKNAVCGRFRLSNLYIVGISAAKFNRVVKIHNTLAGSDADIDNLGRQRTPADFLKSAPLRFMFTLGTVRFL